MHNKLEYLIIVLVTRGITTFIFGSSLSSGAGEDLAFHQKKSTISDLELKYSRDVTSTSLLKNTCGDGTGSCPKWSFCDSERLCQCPASDIDQLNCDLVQNGDNTLLILDCTCITYNRNRSLFEYGLCGYNCRRESYHISFSYQSMPANVLDWDNFTCGDFKRSGTLCGKCDENRNLYPRAYSFDMSCIECTDSKASWWKYVFSAFFPLSIFCFIILLFRINTHSSQLQGYVLYSQFISISALSRALFAASQGRPLLFQIVKLLGSMYGIWNLDFFRMYYPGFCLKIGMLATLCLDFAIALYPLVLMAVTYGLVKLYDQNYKLLIVLWKPFGTFLGIFQNSWEIRTSIIDSFSTFFFLSNMKFLSVCFDMLVPVRVHEFTDARFVNQTWRLYYDATVIYFKGIHVYYGSIAIIILFCFVFLPVLVLLFYPFTLCQKSFTIFPNRWQIFMHTFVDSFQGCYKDGIEPGTRDCRWFSAVILMARFILLMMYAVSLTTSFFSHSAIIFTILAILVIVIDPFKPHLSSHTSILAIYMIFAATFHVSAACLVTISDKSATVPRNILLFVIVTVAILPILYIFALIIHWIIRQRKFRMHSVRHAWKKDYTMFR